MTDSSSWPPLPYPEWADTCDTLHLWMQAVGKTSLALAPFLNEYWQVAFGLTGRGMTTGLLPYRDRAVEIRFDFLDHRLLVEVTDGSHRALDLIPRSVAAFYADYLDALNSLGIEVELNPMPSEVPNAVPLDQDIIHRAYDGAAVTRWWQVLVEIAKVLQRFRSDFAGKSSPVHFFWGSFDLAHTRFSGRPAPLLEGVPRFFRLSEDQENFTCGFWPGNPTAQGATLGEPAFYAYAYPAPAGLESAAIEPVPDARFDSGLGEFLLPYESVRSQADPGSALMRFLQSTYAAAADLGGWDRRALEISPPV